MTYNKDDKICMTDTTKLYILIPVWMTFIKGHWVQRNLELVLSFCCKMAWSSSDIRSDWICKEDDSKEIL